MKVKEIYEEIYNECDSIFGSFLMYLVERHREYFEDDNFIEKIKTNYKDCSASSFRNRYQKWYTNSIIVLNAFLPERKNEFIELYSPDPKRKKLTGLTYKISDAISGLSNSFASPIDSISQVQRQIDIVKSLKDIIDSKIGDIKQIIENDVFENELDSARYLLFKGFNRSAGAICGVLLEKHLKSMVSSRGLIISKRDPSINDLNAELYKNGVIDSTQNKYLLFLGDLRNKCDHDKELEPTKDEITDFINGTNKVIKTYN